MQRYRGPIVPHWPPIAGAQGGVEPPPWWMKFVPLPFQEFVLWDTIPMGQFYYDMGLVKSNIGWLSALVDAYSALYYTYRHALHPSESPSDAPSVTLAWPSGYAPDPPGVVPYDYSAPGASYPVTIGTIASIYNPTTEIRYEGNDDLADYVARISHVALSETAFYWPGESDATVVDSEALVDGEASLSVPCDFATLELLSVPTRYGGIAYGGTRLLTPRLGWLAFGAETHYEDRQKVEFFDTIYRPRAIARPTFVTAKVKPDVEGVLRAWVGWLMV